MTPRLPAHRVTTAHMGAAYPFQAERGLGSRGVYMGHDMHGGGGFFVDGWEWYAAGAVTDPSAIVVGKVGSGKALDVDTPIPTPEGWAQMGDLQPGDQVFDENGKPSSVVAVSDVMQDRPCYEVVFSDGSTIVADAEHLWYTVSNRERNRALMEQWRLRRQVGTAAERARVAALAQAGGPDRVTIPELCGAMGWPVTRIESIYAWLRNLPASQEPRLVRAVSRVGRPLLTCRMVRTYKRNAAVTVMATRLASIRGDQRWKIGDRALVTTEEIRSTLVANGQTNHAVPVARPLQLPPRPLALDPYVLGAWLGDGTSAGATITNPDHDVIRELRNRGVICRPRRQRYVYGLALPGVHAEPRERAICSRCGADFQRSYQDQQFCSQSCGARSGRKRRGQTPSQLRFCSACGRRLPHGSTGRRCRECWRNKTFVGVLRGLDVLGNKHIPSEYLRASEEQRRDLLAGLLDTDGTVTPAGQVEVTFVQERLVRDTIELIHTLGYRTSVTSRRAKLYGRDCGPSWSIRFSTKEHVFKLSRKAAVLERRRRMPVHLPAYRYIREVRAVSSRPVRCIQVASGSGLFLAGRSMILTHNSALLKSFCVRQLVFGRQAWFLDTKGEYDRLCEAVGVSPVHLRPSGMARLNPLDPRVGSDDVRPQLVRDAQLKILEAVAAAALGRRLSSEEQGACAEALREVSARYQEPTLPLVVNEMLEPSLDAATALRTTPRGLASRSREAALALRRLMEGDLAGMFDGPTTLDVDLTAPVVSLNLRAVYESDALGILMICAAAWLRRAVDRDDGVKRILVVDEAWKVLTRLEVARWLQENWKLTRSTAVQCVAVIHRLSDLEAAGGRDSEQVRLARGLLSDSETKVIFRQDPAELALMRELCQLSERETAVVGSLPKGCALWKVGQRSFQVEHHLSAFEREVTYTDDRMRVA